MFSSFLTGLLFKPMLHWSCLYITLNDFSATFKRAVLHNILEVQTDFDPSENSRFTHVTVQKKKERKKLKISPKNDKSGKKQDLRTPSTTYSIILIMTMIKSKNVIDSDLPYNAYSFQGWLKCLPCNFFFFFFFSISYILINHLLYDYINLNSSHDRLPLSHTNTRTTASRS